MLQHGTYEATYAHRLPIILSEDQGCDGLGVIRWRLAFLTCVNVSVSYH